MEPAALDGARFAIAAPADLRVALDAIDAGGADAPLAALRAQASDLAHRYIDAVLDGFLLALARAVRGVPGAGARTAGIVRGFADRFVTPGVRGARKEQIDDFLGFLRHHLLAQDGRSVIAFTVDEDFAALLGPALAATADRDALHPALHAMIDACMHHFLDAPLAMLHLGLFARAAIAMGRSGVTTRAHGLVDDVLGKADPAPLARLTGFLTNAIAIRRAAPARTGA